MGVKGFAENIGASLKYQCQRRINNIISSLISIGIFFGFIWVYRELAVKYWPGFIEKYWEQRKIVYMVLMVGLSFTNNIVNILVYYLIDKFKLLESYKITRTGLMWEEDKPKWITLRNKAIKLNLINIGIIGTMGVILDSIFLRDSTMSASIPEYSTIFIHFFFCMMVEGILFYVFHKVGHLYLYKYHKIHHEFHVPTPLATTYFHPIDYILGVVIPFAAGPKLLARQIHILTLMFWMIYRIGEGHDGHSNYELPWSPFRALPFSTTSEYHSYHHTHNQGNFGSTDMVPDTAMYDNSSFFKYKQSTSKKDTRAQSTSTNSKKVKNK